MFPVKCNFRHSFENLLCSLCSNFEEDQNHFLVCEEILNDEEIKDMILKSKIVYEDIFGPPSKQILAIKVWKKIHFLRNRKLDKKENGK